jgi:hypothetical protein
MYLNYEICYGKQMFREKSEVYFFPINHLNLFTLSSEHYTLNYNSLHDN